MKTVILVCVAVALIGKITKMLITISKKESLSYIIDVFVGGVIILIVLQSISARDFPEISIELNDSNYYESIGEGSLETIIEAAESETEKAVITKINGEFGLNPRKCDIEIGRNDMKVKSAKIFLDSGERLISGYEIKEYIKTEFDIEVEVVFF